MHAQIHRDALARLAKTYGMICEEVKRPENRYEAAATLLGSERPFGQVHLVWQIFGLEEEEDDEDEEEEDADDDEEEEEEEEEDADDEDEEDEEDHDDHDDDNEEEEEENDSQSQRRLALKK